MLKAIIAHPIRSLKYPRSIIEPNRWCSDAFVKYLRTKGATIGKDTRFISPRSCDVDINRAQYITIGDNCCLSVVTLLAHDYSWYTLFDAYDDILPDGGGKIVIGNNCFIGYNAVLLKNTEIGNNCIIGARAVIKGKIPSGTVWAGCPAKQICTIEDFYKKKKNNRLKEALYRRDFIREKMQRNPSILEMGLFCFLFLERTDCNYERYVKNVEFNGIKEHKQLRHHFFSTVPFFSSFEEFLNYSIAIN